jgi:hypothetical protein
MPYQMLRLQDALGVPMNEAQGIAHLGSLDDQLVSKLLTNYFATGSASARFTDGWSGATEDVRFHPDSDHVRDMLAKWTDCSELVKDRELIEQLKSMLPNPTGLVKLYASYLISDYVGYHHDRNSSVHCEQSIVILLHAPKGCKLLSNGEVLTEAKPGDVFLLEDQEFHGAYPILPTPANAHKLDIIGETEGSTSFSIDNCMVFVLINRKAQSVKVS